MARKITPAMAFFRDVQKAAPDIPFSRRAELARFARRAWHRGERDPRAVVSAFLGGRARARNPDEMAKLLLGIGLGALAFYLLSRPAGPQVSSPPAPAPQPTPPPSGGCGCR